MHNFKNVSNNIKRFDLLTAHDQYQQICFVLRCVNKYADFLYDTDAFCYGSRNL